MTHDVDLAPTSGAIFDKLVDKVRRLVGASIPETLYDQERNNTVTLDESLATIHPIRPIKTG